MKVEAVPEHTKRSCSLVIFFSALWLPPLVPTLALAHHSSSSTSFSVVRCFSSYFAAVLSTNRGYERTRQNSTWGGRRRTCNWHNFWKNDEENVGEINGEYPFLIPCFMMATTPFICSRLSVIMYTVLPCPEFVDCPLLSVFLTFGALEMSDLHHCQLKFLLSRHMLCR